MSLATSAAEGASEVALLWVAVVRAAVAAARVVKVAAGPGAVVAMPAAKAALAGVAG